MAELLSLPIPKHPSLRPVFSLETARLITQSLIIFLSPSQLCKFRLSVPMHANLVGLSVQPCSLLLGTDKLTVLINFGLGSSNSFTKTLPHSPLITELHPTPWTIPGSSAASQYVLPSQLCHPWMNPAKNL